MRYPKKERWISVDKPKIIFPHPVAKAGNDFGSRQGGIGTHGHTMEQGTP